MHANNEIGNLLPINQVGLICEKYNAIFHSDTVQTMAHYRFDLKVTKITGLIVIIGSIVLTVVFYLIGKNFF